MKCPICSADNDADDHFCGSCGAPLARRCVSCAAELKPGRKFCTQCGATVDGDAVDCSHLNCGHGRSQITRQAPGR